MPDPDVDPQKAKDGVLGEVRALRPNHESRLEAIERAEKARQRELEDRKEGAFKKELGKFVDEGKLKKSGGVEEAESQRKLKDERNRREAWEKQQQRQAAPGEKGKGSEEGENTHEPVAAEEEPIIDSRGVAINGTMMEGAVAEQEMTAPRLPPFEASTNKGEESYSILKPIVQTS